jgi:predicted amidohydrolase YtcJ
MQPDKSRHAVDPQPLPHADLLLTNARVLTLERRQPQAQAVAIGGDTILAVGSAAGTARWRGPGTQVIDCRDLTLLPGLVDAHCHLLALAGSLMGVDCSPTVVGSIAQLQGEIRRRAQQTPHGAWIRGYGYDQRSLAEGRHPTRWELDAAAPGHPVRLEHRSGHAVALNSPALALAGIHRDTPDPPEGVIQRDEASGEPTGVLLEMAAFLRRRLGKTRDPDVLDQGITRMNHKLLEYGITSAQDAGPGNGLERWETFKELKDSGRLESRITMMAGARAVGELAAGLAWGRGNEDLSLGHAKIMLTMTTGDLHPGQEELEELVAQAHAAGFPVAIHAVEQEAVAASARALEAGPKADRGACRRPRDRIEHCSECPPELLARVKSSGAMVVTQPGFVYWNGEGYRRDVTPELLPHLYPVAALHRAGVPLAFGSDAPVIDPNPWPAIASAATGLTRDGRPLAQGCPHPLVPVLEALRMYTINGARAEGTQDRKGSIRAGKLADLVLVNADPTSIKPRDLQDIKAVLTVVGGRVVWERGG